MYILLSTHVIDAVHDVSRFYVFILMKLRFSHLQFISYFIGSNLLTPPYTPLCGIIVVKHFKINYKSFNVVQLE